MRTVAGRCTPFDDGSNPYRATAFSIAVTLGTTGLSAEQIASKAKNAVTGAPVSEGKATRVYARINEDGSLSSQPIPVEMLTALNELGGLTHLKTNSGATRLGAER